MELGIFDAIDREKRIDPESNAPTPERARIANGSLEPLPINDRSSYRVIGTAFRIAPPVSKMFHNDQIGEDELRAAGIFSADFEIGMRVRVTGRYGIDLAMASVSGRSGGTPLSQQKDIGSLTPEERRAHHHNRWMKACRHIGHPLTAEWLTYLVAEVPLPGRNNSPTLADLGAAFMPYRTTKQCGAAGATLVKSGLERLVYFYGI